MTPSKIASNSCNVFNRFQHKDGWLFNRTNRDKTVRCVNNSERSSTEGWPTVKNPNYPPRPRRAISCGGLVATAGSSTRVTNKFPTSTAWQGQEKQTKKMFEEGFRAIHQLQSRETKDKTFPSVKSARKDDEVSKPNTDMFLHQTQKLLSTILRYTSAHTHFRTAPWPPP